MPDQQKFTDPETGKPIVYADNVPWLLRGLHIERWVMEDGDLDEIPHHERAKKGKDAWNRWVVWAEKKHGRWLEREDRGDHIYFQVYQPPGLMAVDQQYVDKGGIRFDSCDIQDDDKVLDDFSGFVFPCPVAFSGFQDEKLSPTKFDHSVFCSYVEFEEAEFSKKISFKDCQFWGGVNFRNSKFGEIVSFRGSGFATWILARGVQFQQGCDWSECNFSGFVSFEKAKFKEAQDFRFSEFKKSIDLTYAEFGREAGDQNSGHINVPDLRSTGFEIVPDLGRVKVHESEGNTASFRQRLIAFTGVRPLIVRSGEDDDASRYRRLQELAAEGHHHLEEKRFFRKELLARRGWETDSWQEIAMINLFELFSRCGLSFWVPFWWWIGLFATFCIFYGGLAGMFDWNFSGEDYFHLINYTFSNATPVLGVIKASDSAAVQALFTGGQPPWVTLLAGVHNLISTIFLFFALLAIRNYFKLG